MNRATAAAIQIGMIGAMGEGAVLCHSLADCYPYKMMWHPSAQFYATVGYVGLVLGPVGAFLAMLAVRDRNLSVLPALGAAVCPGVVLAVFEVASMATGANAWDGSGNMDHRTNADCRSALQSEIAGLVICGALIGAVLGSILSLVSAALARRYESPGANTPPIERTRRWLQIRSIGDRATGTTRDER